MDNDEGSEALQVMAAAVSQLPPSLQTVAARLEGPTLHAASAAGELDLVDGLLKAGLAPDMYPCSEDEDDEPPLTWIARYRDRTTDDALDVATLLIGRGAGLDEGLPLLAAAEVEDLSMMRLLLAAGADPDLALEDAEPKEATLLEQVLALGWHSHPHTSGDYFIAFDDDQTILAVGESKADVHKAAASADSDNGVNFSLATERLVARFLSGEDLCWVTSGLADLEDSEDESA